MSVDWVNELAAGRGAVDTLTPYRTWATGTYTRRFQVKTNNRFDGPAVIRASGAIPFLLDPYIAGNDVDLFAYVNNVSYNQPEKFQYIWEVVVEYERADNPILRPHIISTSKSVHERIVWQDVYNLTPAGKPVPIVNSAKCYFDPPVVIDDVRSVFSVQRNDPITLDPVDLSAAFTNRINLDYFFGQPPFTVKCLGITGTDAYEGGMWYWANTYEFEIRPDTWILNILDQGTMGGEWDATNSKWVVAKLKDKDGNPVSEPVPLNGQGFAITGDPATQTIDPDEFVFLPFNVFLGTFFSALGLP